MGTTGSGNVPNTMVVESPSFLEKLEELSGMPPNVQLQNRGDMITMRTWNVNVRNQTGRWLIYMIYLLTNGSRRIRLIQIWR